MTRYHDLQKIVNLFYDYPTKSSVLQAVSECGRIENMDLLPVNNILKFHPDTLEAVRKMYGLEKPGEMSSAIDIIEEWVTKQHHFVKKSFNRGYLERLIITCKGSVERAKSRLDKVCTLRTLAPNYFGDYDIRKDYETIENKIMYAPVTRLTKEHERMYMSKFIGKKFDAQVFLAGFRVCTRHTEYLKFYDYANYYVFIADLTDVSIPDMVANMNLFDVRQLMFILMDGYGMRIKEIHLVTPSKMIELLVAFLKQVFSEKLSGRIFVHKNIESVHKVVPKEVLPKDYGGEDISLKELHKKWQNEVTSQEFRDYCNEMNSACTDESLRQTDKFNEQYLGMPGTFRTLSVD